MRRQRRLPNDLMALRVGTRYREAYSTPGLFEQLKPNAVSVTPRRRAPPAFQAAWSDHYLIPLRNRLGLEYHHELGYLADSPELRGITVRHGGSRPRDGPSRFSSWTSKDIRRYTRGLPAF